MSKFCSIISDEQLYRDKSYHFDPDSSPEAWEYYRKCYTVEKWGSLKQYNLNELHFFEYFNGDYVDAPLSFYNRLNALPNEAEVTVPENNGYRFYKATRRLAGETDFNFNDIKYSRYKKMLFEQYMKNEVDQETLHKNFEKLDKCNQMHHTVLNFSLMQVMGNMQGIKSKGLFLNRKYEYLDRLDTFVYMLSCCLNKIGTDELNNDSIIQNVTAVENKEELKKYLKEFSNIYDYCKKVYFIEEKEFVDKVIESGKKPITSGKEVVGYMSLAFQFWNKKKEYLEKL